MNIPKLPLSSITVSGQDRLKWCQGLVTQDINQSKAVTTFACNHQGKTIAMIWVLHAEENLHLITHESTRDALFDHLVNYILTEDIVISKDQRPIYGCLQTHMDWSYDYALTWSVPEIPLSPALWHQKLAEQQTVLVTQHSSRQWLPSLLTHRLFDWVSLTKGCYLGQEILARLHHKGTLKKQLIQLNGSYSLGSTIKHGNTNAYVVDVVSPSAAWAIG